MINLSIEEKNIFVSSYIQNEIAIELLDVKPNTKFEKTILDEFEYLLELSKIENVKNWCKNNNLKDVKVTDYLERIIETKSGKVLLGIRFLGMDITKPFVNVWSSFAIEKEFENIVKIAKVEFKIFNPKYLRFWVKPNSNLHLKYKVFQEQSFYANYIEAICKKEFPINYDDIVLEKITDLDFFDWYKNLYYEFHLEMKDLKFLITPNEKEDFKSCISEDLIFYIIYKNERIGLISANKDTFLGEDSIYITEIIIQKEHRGKKIATTTQRKLVELNKKVYKYIWGKISKKNIPSQKNALRLGRKIISTEILFPF